MEGDPISDWESATTINVVNLVIVGNAGNGKSAVGNNILGRKAFLSKRSPVGVTCTSKLKYTLKDGRIVDVIDTPGLFSSELIGRELVKCIDLAKDVIHAVLLVFSIGSRFTNEEEAAIECVKSLFGDEIFNYIIVVFTGGDTLESEGMNLMDYISICPEPLMNILKLCKHRVILFDNTTEDMIKREKQVNDLLFLVERAIADNGGKPYSNQNSAELKAEEELERLGKQLAEEQAAWQVAERLAKESREKSEKEIQMLNEELILAKIESGELRRRVTFLHKCPIL